MNRNDPEGFAQRLYARIPGHYRVYDSERGQPLLALLRVVGEQVANVRQDLDALWDDFFIETCQDWVVPYLGALIGTNLLPQPIDARSNRLDVWNTVGWRRTKGTPLMLAALSQAISGWNSDLAEFFELLGWSQNMNHVRLDRPLNPDLRDSFQLSLLGRASDPFDRAADFKSAQPPRSSPDRQMQFRNRRRSLVNPGPVSNQEYRHFRAPSANLPSSRGNTCGSAARGWSTFESELFHFRSPLPRDSDFR